MTDAKRKEKSNRFKMNSKTLGFLSLLFLLIMLPVTIVLTNHQTDTQSRAAGLACFNAPVSYQVVGKQILDNNNNVFVPYGIQMGGPDMASATWQTNNSSYITQSALQQAYTFWHSNTTRLQISSANLFSGTSYPHYNSAYLARIDQIVTWATQLNMNIILSLQYQASTKQPMPTQDSINFWNIIAPHYANNQRVFFDIFNESHPETALCAPDHTDAVWNFWQAGSASTTVSSCTPPLTSYVGMQDLVNAIRAAGAQNLIFAEGISGAENIGLLPTHTLSGSNIVYAIHPYDEISTTQANWDSRFGSAAVTGNFPVVADEWNQDSTGNNCSVNAPTVVPTFLSYLYSHNIGIIGFAYYPGTMNRAWDITNPTRYSGSTTVCGTSPSSPTAEGSGQLLLQQFTNYSVQLSVCPTPTLTPTYIPTPTFTPTPTPSPTPSRSPTPTVRPTPLPAPVASDTFTRPNQTYWGTASDGHIWTGDANSNSVFSIVTNGGRITRTTSTNNALLGPQVQNAEVIMTGIAHNYNSTKLGVLLRYTDGNNNYLAYIDGSRFVIQKKEHGVIQSLGSIQYPATALSAYRIRFRAQGNSLFAKVWQAGLPEPINWMISATDITFTNGLAGVHFYSQTGSSATFTSFMISSL